MKQSDYFEILDMMKKFILHELPKELQKYDNQKLIDLFNKTLNEQSAFCLVDEDDNVVGCLACLLSEIMFSKQKVALELVFWLEPEYRNSKSSVLLLQYYEEWARKKGCDLISLVHMENNSKDKAKHLYNKLGYTQTEYSYIKELN